MQSTTTGIEELYTEASTTLCKHQHYASITCCQQNLLILSVISLGWFCVTLIAGVSLFSSGAQGTGSTTDHRSRGQGLIDLLRVLRWSAGFQLGRSELKSIAADHFNFLLMAFAASSVISHEIHECQSSARFLLCKMTQQCSKLKGENLTFKS